MDYKDTKLIVFLKTFSNRELNDLERFIASPFFRQSRDPLPLLKVLRKFHPDFESDKFREENVFRELYPDSDFSDKKSQNNFRSLSSYLLKALEEYLFVSGVCEDDALRKRIILDKLLSRNLLKYCDQYLKSAYEVLKDRLRVSVHSDIEEFLLSEIHSRFYTMKADLIGYLEVNFRSVEILSACYWTSVLRIAKTKYLVETYRQIDSGNNSIEEFINSSDVERILEIHEGSSQYVDLCFNYFTYMSLRNDNDAEYYEKAKKIFFENKSGISRADMNYYYSDLININSAIMEKSDENGSEEYSLLVSCLEDKAYKVSDSDFMPPDFFRNVIVSANRQRKFEFAEKFVSEFADELMPEIRESLVNYSKGLISFGKKEFEKSLEYISRVKYDLVSFKSDLKIMMLKIFYELEMYEQIYSLSDTFKHYIRNSKNLSNSIKHSYESFVNYYLKILKLKSSSDKNESAHIRKHLEKEISITQKIWLLEKLDELDLQNESKRT